MIISPKVIREKGIIYCNSKPFSRDQFQPNGIDVRVDTIQRIGNKINNSVFSINVDDVKEKVPLSTLSLDRKYPFHSEEKPSFELKKFCPYCVECFESVVVPENTIAMIYGRSTLNRSGILIRSSVYDSGFICEKIGFTLYPWNDCVIERGSRIAQIIFVAAESDFLYNGQYQGKYLL